MTIRPTTLNDLDRILMIIKDAQEYLKSNNIEQWQNGYPGRDTFLQDIKDDVSYVVTLKETIIGTFMMSFDIEKTYNTIYEGSWLNPDKYCVIHRIAISDEYKGKGIAGFIIDYVKAQCLIKNVKSIRIDTHEYNISMQKSVLKNGFQKCGHIYLLDDAKRIAFEKIVV